MNGKFLNTTLAVPRIASRSSALKSNSLWSSLSVSSVAIRSVRYNDSPDKSSSVWLLIYSANGSISFWISSFADEVISFCTRKKWLD